MVSSPVRHRDRKHLVRQSLHDIATFQIILAIAIRSQPPWRNIVHPINRHQRIVVDLGNLVAKARHVQRCRVPENGLVPSRVVHDKKSEQFSVAVIPRLLINGVESTDAAARRVLPSREIQESRRKKESRYVLRCNVSRSFRRSHHRRAVRWKLEGRRKQLARESVDVDQHKKAAAPVRIHRVLVIAVSAQPLPDSAGLVLIDHHRSPGLQCWRQQCMPVVRRALVFGARHRVRKLRRRSTARVIRVRERRRLQRRLHKWCRVKQQPLAARLNWCPARMRFAVHNFHVSWRSVSIPQIQRHRYEWCVDRRRSSRVGPLAQRVEQPIALRFAVRIKAWRRVRPAEVGHRIDASNARQRSLLRSVQARGLGVYPNELQVLARYIRRGNLIRVLRPHTNRARHRKNASNQPHPQQSVPRHHSAKFFHCTHPFT